MRDAKRVPSPRQELLALMLPAAMLAVVAAHQHGVGSAFALSVTAARATPALRVCTDPNDLPFSNRVGQGFESKVAGLIGAELGHPVEYTWWAQRGGFVRNTLSAGACDVAVDRGPLAGYFAKRSPVPITPLMPSIDPPHLPFVVDIAMGVRRRDTTVRREIERIIDCRRPTIDSILAAYGVPRAGPASAVATREGR